MESVSTAILLVLALVAFNNYRHGTLGDWLRAKFLGSAAPKDGAGAAPAGATVATGPRDAAVQASGRLLHPTGGRDSSPEGASGLFGAARPGGRKHAGEDYGVPVGTPILAAAGGRVILAGWSGGYGKRIDIDHGGGLTTRYAHLSEFLVRVGQTVKAGEAIARSGNTGSSSGPHLHFEVRRFGAAQNPRQYVTTAALATSDGWV